MVNGMAEFISSEVAIRKTEVFCDVFDTKWTDEKVLAWIANLPTVDAVPVVRCKDCKACLIDNTVRAHHICMRVQNVIPRRVELMDFCSYGERKDGDG